MRRLSYADRRTGHAPAGHGFRRRHGVPRNRVSRSRSANITPDADTGIGTWTEQQFIDRFKSFENTTPPVLSEVERRQNTPMPWTAYAGMTREDLAAIYTALRAQKPIINRVTRFPDAQTPR